MEIDLSPGVAVPPTSGDGGKWKRSAGKAKGDPLASLARELIGLGPDAFFSPLAIELAVEVGRRHPAGALHTRSTAEAIAHSGLPGVDPEAIAAEVFSNFVWTHFVCKLLMTAAPEATVAFLAEHLDASAVKASLDEAGPSILSCFHYSGYPLVAFALAISAAAPLISKARMDVLDRSAGGPSGRVVHVSSRSAAIRLTRALRRGRSVWVLLDVVLPSVRSVRARFLGGEMNVGAGIGKIARLSDRPCLPIFWGWEWRNARVRAAPAVFPAQGHEGGTVQACVDAQAAFIRERPAQWLEWYSVLDETLSVRTEVKRGNDLVWECLGPALDR